MSAKPEAARGSRRGGGGDLARGRRGRLLAVRLADGRDNAVHASGVYAARGANRLANTSDGIFADSLASELVTPSGSPSTGYTASFQIGVSL